MKIKGNINKFYYSAFPMQAVLITCNDENGKTNVITIAWHTTISKKPPLYGISVAPGRHSHKLIEKTKEFAINFMPYDLIDKVHFCGTHSGRNIDKIKETGLTLVDSENIKTKIIKEGFAHFECKLFDKISLGDHTFFVGEIVNLLNEKDAFMDDLLENEKVKPVYYLGNNIYTSVDEIRDGF